MSRRRQKFKTIDLCAGIGGIRRGFELTGDFENVLSAEIDPYAIKTYQHLYGDDAGNDLTSDLFRMKAMSTEYDVLLAGFPCQSFSSAGKKLGFRDTTKGTIFFSIAELISLTKPKAIFLENVEYLVSHDHGNTIRTIINTLENELEYRIIGVDLDEEGNYNYSSSSFVRNSKDFGVPQNRPRTYIMGFSKKIYGSAIKELNNALPSGWDDEHIECKTPYKDISSILDENVDLKYYLSSGYWETLKQHRSRQKDNGYGFGYCIVNKEGRTPQIANTIMATGGSGKERNLIYQPRDDIKENMIVGKKKSPLNLDGIRTMTPIEWGRLQGFVNYGFVDSDGEDHFSFPDSMTDNQKYKQLGNSVTIPVIRAMAEFMLDCFDVLEESREEIVELMADRKPVFSKKDVMELLRYDQYEAWYLLQKMLRKGKITIISHGRHSKYVINHCI